MDREAELVRSENWSELRKYYGTHAGHAWELGWVNLLKIRDLAKAGEAFDHAFKESRYRDASYILLKKLGRTVSAIPKDLPPSLKLFEAFKSGRWPELLSFLKATPENKRFAYAFVRQGLDQINETTAQALAQLEMSAPAEFLLGSHCEKRLRRLELAEELYSRFYQDPWSRRLLDEVGRLIFDAEMSKRLRTAYERKDAVTVRRLLKAAVFRLEKLQDQALSEVWIEALKEAFDLEERLLTEHGFGYAFWKSFDLSPEALALLRERLFSPEPVEEPYFVTQWRLYFEGESYEPPVIEMDQDNFAIWQIRAEFDAEALSEALLRFPADERLLFLWSLRHGERAPAGVRKWPEDVQESDVVRKNLERAFDRSADKSLWFERLRSVGCSQSFYEYALSRAETPISWVLEDLRTAVIRPTPAIREFFSKRLSVADSQALSSENLTTEQINEVLSYLTPAEAQQVLLSRFVLAPISPTLLSDEALDLLWEARSRVSEETRKRWIEEISQWLSTKATSNLRARHWRWIESAWELKDEWLNRFSPVGAVDFPWESYLDRLAQLGKSEEIISRLREIPDERMRERWIEWALQTGVHDIRMKSAIESLQTDYSRSGLLALWYESNLDWSKAIEARQEELSQTPIVNEQMRITRQILDLHRKAKASSSSVTDVESVLQLARFLESNGSLDANLCLELSKLLEEKSELFQAWKFIMQGWMRSQESVRESLLPRVLDLGFRARAVDETQRFLVDQLFQTEGPTPLATQIMSALLEEKSYLRLKHLRTEFIEHASQICPVHRELLRERAARDYRAVLLWEAFYGEGLSLTASVPSVSGKRVFELWGLTDSHSLPEAFATYAKYLDHLPLADRKTESHEFLEKAQRMVEKVFKQFRVGKAPVVLLKNDQLSPIRLGFHPANICLQPEFFAILDEETWTAIGVGFAQVLADRERGLFDDRRLMERFFQGMLLSGAPIQKLIRLWVWLAMNESLIDPTFLKSQPQKLITELPFLNQLLIFYLSSDMQQKMSQTGLIPS